MFMCDIPKIIYNHGRRFDFRLTANLTFSYVKWTNRFKCNTYD